MTDREEFLARIREKAQVKAAKRPAPRRHVAREAEEENPPPLTRDDLLEAFLEAPGSREIHDLLVEHFGARLIEFRPNRE